MIRIKSLIEEKERFLSNPNYSPQFIYKKPEVDLEHILRDVSALPRDIDHPLADLFISKIDEIISKMHLIDSVGTDGFTQASEDLYGKVDNNLYNQAVQYIKKLNIEEDKSKILGTKQIIKRIEHFLSEYKLTGWKVKVSEKQTADIAINKSGNILLKSNVKFTENRLKAVIAHEICTHVYRYENGAMQKYKIFAQGTSNYLQTEEGLAVYNQKAIGVPLGEKDKWAALRVIAAYKAKEMSFKELYSYLKYEYELDDESAWKSCIRAKRGITNTSSYGAFTRDIIYFKGYLEVKNHIEKHGRRGMKELYVGKISIDDLKYLVHLGEYKVKYLPPEKIELQK